MVRVKIEHTNGNIDIHFAIDGRDTAICGHDLHGDYDWGTGEQTNKPVNCPQCLELVRNIKKLRLKKVEIGSAKLN